MTATVVTAEQLLAGAADKHGEHENRTQGWDKWSRTRAHLNPGADTYGRHAAHDLEVRP